MEEAQQSVNNEKELYREPAKSEGMSYYSPHLSLIEGETPSIQMCAGGNCVAMPIKDWVALAWKGVDNAFGADTGLSKAKSLGTIKESK